MITNAPTMARIEAIRQSISNIWRYKGKKGAPEGSWQMKIVTLAVCLACAWHKAHKLTSDHTIFYLAEVICIFRINGKVCRCHKLT